MPITTTTLTKPNLHQRHKSTGALSNMLAVGGLKAAAKRTAFGDVSNTVRALTTVNDDSAIPNKQVNLDMVKPIIIQEKSAAFLRPAQRPINTAASKVPLNSVPSLSTELANSTVTSKASLIEIRQQIPPAPANKRTLSKKGTTIYKDTVGETGVSAPTQAARPESVPVAPVHQSLGPRPQKSQAQLKQDEVVEQQAVSKTLNHNQEVSEIAESSHQIYVDAHEHVTTEAYDSYVRSMEQNEEKAITVPPSVMPVQEAINIPATSLVAPIGSEPEEYWEDDDEIYDEHGYTTAHSRGDNTTGGATTVLFPKVTNRAKREIEVATALVESSRTQEEIEDEAWDTSMVAEYGDEIFAYMRELEVSINTIIVDTVNNMHSCSLICRHLMSRFI